MKPTDKLVKKTSLISSRFWERKNTVLFSFENFTHELLKTRKIFDTILWNWQRIIVFYDIDEAHKLKNFTTFEFSRFMENLFLFQEKFFSRCCLFIQLFLSLLEKCQPYWVMHSQMLINLRNGKKKLRTRISIIMWEKNFIWTNLNRKSEMKPPTRWLLVLTDAYATVCGFENLKCLWMLTLTLLGGFEIF